MWCATNQFIHTFTPKTAHSVQHTTHQVSTGKPVHPHLGAAAVGVQWVQIDQNSKVALLLVQLEFVVCVPLLHARAC